MIKKTQATTVVFLALFVLGLTTMRCDCEGVGESCETVSDCEEYELPAGCVEWLCLEGVCVPDCPECDQDVDCEGKVWGNGQCTEDEGHWECQQGVCQPICDFECTLPSDCSSKDWPGDASCDEADGHWDCSQGSCVPVCDGCTLASDCETNTWTKCCTGHWECDQGSCLAVCDEGCEVADDCLNNTWPELMVCTVDQGHWVCSGCECVPVCDFNCQTIPECVEREWSEACLGHWDCVDGWCSQVCENVACGDDDCDAAGGETETSCPDDCAAGCTEPADCLGRVWGIRCQGRFDCVAEKCERLCDYALCSNGQCDDTQGESPESCPDDCMTTCESNLDCLDEDWTSFCIGRFNCWIGDCKQVCDDVMCGNGTCQPELGESGKSCSTDCGSGSCSDVADCFGFTWSGCNGHWSCTAANICEEVCEDTTCSDGTCDVLAGETPWGCAADCADYSCQNNTDCDALSLPNGCTGAFICLDRVCLPECD
ncbi:MAG: hypothetical protein JRJ87_05900 [Deltaproteobacteria bacterium]|nr:hypothetical protein [Deltaproteobacteria bacterium]